MNFRSKSRDEVDLDITPLIDVVFLLLIFFMVSTTFEHNSEINITLPSSSKDVTEKISDAVNISLDAQGNVYINGEIIRNDQLETIKMALSDALIGSKEPPIIINADSNATHQSVVKIMDVASQLGLFNITFATQKIKDKK
ncbi:MAG: biopolymer transporter ExbD [Legionellales bacterium]|nr:biopolymer transporter ExbD [Legionellales bacterium]